VTGWQAAAGLVPAVLASTGPDLDNTRTAKRLDGWLPDEALGGCGPLQHRGLAHWWGIPAAAWLVADRLPAGWWQWAILAAILGWASHLLGDLTFGKAGFGTGQGVPLLPWGWHVGLGFKVGSRFERAVAWGLTVAAGWLLVGSPGRSAIWVMVRDNYL
jgi:hypothetical protein